MDVEAGIVERIKEISGSGFTQGATKVGTGKVILIRFVLQIKKMFEIDVGLATVADKILDVHCIGPICDKGIHSTRGCSGRGCKKCRHSLRFQVRSTVF